MHIYEDTQYRYKGIGGRDYEIYLQNFIRFYVEFEVLTEVTSTRFLVVLPCIPVESQYFG
jgi:hypothetical protein